MALPESSTPASRSPLPAATQTTTSQAMAAKETIAALTERDRPEVAEREGLHFQDDDLAQALLCAPSDKLDSPRPWVRTTEKGSRSTVCLRPPETGTEREAGHPPVVVSTAGDAQSASAMKHR